MARAGSISMAPPLSPRRMRSLLVPKASSRFGRQSRTMRSSPHVASRLSALLEHAHLQRVCGGEKREREKKKQLQEKMGKEEKEKEKKKEKEKEKEEKEKEKKKRKDGGKRQQYRAGC